MDLTQLRMFCAVAESGSLARAAALLQRVPSNLTTRLRQLEQELGCALFIREKQRLRLSPMGHNFLGYAQRILALSQEARHMAQSGAPAGPFRLGCMESTAASRLPALLSRFHQRYPQVALTLHTATSGELLAQVREGTLAAALVEGSLQGDDLHGCAVFTEQLVAISALGQPPLRSARDAAGVTLYALGPGCACRLRGERWFREAQCQPAAIGEVTSYASLLACVACGAGIAVLPRAVLESMAGADRVQIHPLPPALRDSETLLVWRRDAFTPNVAALKTLIIDQVEC
ncbi:LysR family transcriptional regulator [Pantoea sp. 1.19]|uniref:LysR family transcriptional regulator n=1 Tax=Pantoea sp. 1.19 TaxID=1925589 RepID=UPI00094904C1|nr:LysR family transcriptional regulator [Pantoea sp. 1.19]